MNKKSLHRGVEALFCAGRVRMDCGPGHRFLVAQKNAQNKQTIGGRFGGLYKKLYLCSINEASIGTTIAQAINTTTS